MRPYCRHSPHNYDVNWVWINQVLVKVAANENIEWQRCNLAAWGVDYAGISEGDLSRQASLVDRMPGWMSRDGPGSPPASVPYRYKHYEVGGRGRRRGHIHNEGMHSFSPNTEGLPLFASGEQTSAEVCFKRWAGKDICNYGGCIARVCKFAVELVLWVKSLFMVGGSMLHFADSIMGTFVLLDLSACSLDIKVTANWFHGLWILKLKKPYKGENFVLYDKLNLAIPSAPLKVHVHGQSTL